MGRYFKYILLITFLAAILVIVFLQFNSNRSINQLIRGNEDLLDELNIKNNLQQLKTDIVTLESKVRGTLIGGVAIDTDHLQKEIRSIQQSLQQLDVLQSDTLITSLIIDLDKAINEKIVFNQAVLGTFSIRGKKAAEKMINTHYGTDLTDSIKTIAVKIDDLHQLAVTDLIKKANNNGRKARALGSILALIAALASIITFGYISYKLREQQYLIAKLNSSEKTAREAVQVKEKFLANMSHEIRTPLNAILGFTNLLQRKEQDNESKEFVQTIQRSGENLLAVINDILDLSKIEAGMMRIESVPFSVRGLVHSIATMFRVKAVEKNLILSTKVDSSIPDTLEGDATRLTQILVNLIDNAIKFTNKGNISVEITNEGISGKEIRTGIIVNDTGIGIEKEKLKNVFGRFQQAEDSITRKYGGTGLGLSIVKDLVLLQQGKIDVNSQPGIGTSFKSVIPYKIADAEINKPIAMWNKQFDQYDVEHICILVVEDNEINQNLINHLFNSWGLKFDISVNGKQAIEMLSGKKYDLVLMDIQMPELDGYSATQEIRNGLKLDTPIIAMTAHTMPGEREKCLSFGMNEYISKPIREEQLYKLISLFLPAKQNNGLNNISGKNNPVESYRYINFQYLNEISNGDKAFEKTVTAQFIEAIPESIMALENAWHNRDIPDLRHQAHNMKTTVSVMGLNESLQPFLDALENENINSESFQKNISPVKRICEIALEEAKQFYNTL